MEHETVLITNYHIFSSVFKTLFPVFLFSRFLTEFLIICHQYYLNTYNSSEYKLGKKVITVLRRLSTRWNTLSADWFIKWLKNEYFREGLSICPFSDCKLLEFRRSFLALLFSVYNIRVPTMYLKGKES